METKQLADDLNKSM